MFKKTVLALVAGSSILLFLSVPLWGVSQRLGGAIVDEDYEKLKIFADVISIVQDNYAEDVKTKDLIYSAIKGMLKGLDPHSSFLTPDDYKEMQIETKGVFAGVGIEIGIRDGILTVVSPIEGTPADKAGILPKDKIIKIDDTPTKDMNLNDAVKLIRGEKGVAVTLWILREGFEDVKPFKLIREVIKIKSVRWKMLEEGFGYVRIAQFQESTDSDVEKALKELAPKEGVMKGLILDLRNNPGGLLSQAINISDAFLSSGTIVSTKGRSQGQTVKYDAERGGTQPYYPMVVLVNEGSASASEIVAGALQDNKRAVVLGTPTFGKGSVQTIIPLSDGSAVRITTSLYYTPSGKSIQAKGIEPDIVVGEDIATHLKEKDLPRHFEEVEREDEGEKIKVQEKSSAEDRKEDIQLKRAVDYLKSWHIFSETMKKAM